LDLASIRALAPLHGEAAAYPAPRLHLKHDVRGGDIRCDLAADAVERVRPGAPHEAL